MQKQKQNDCVNVKNKIQEVLYQKYKDLTDEQREITIERNLTTSDSPIAVFWRKNVLQVADIKVKYKSKNK